MRRILWISLAPALTTIVAVALFLSISDQLHLYSGLNVASVSVAEATVERIRLLWGAAAFGLGVALLWNIAIAVLILADALREQSRSLQSTLICAIVAVNILGWWYLSHHDPSGPLAKELLDRITTSANVNVWLLTDIGNRLALLAAAYILASACSLTLASHGQTIKSLSQAVRHWQLSLYSASVLLAVGLFEVWALFRFGATVSESNNATSVASMADGEALASGIVFTVFLAAIYTPVAVVHHHWLAHRVSDAADRIKDLDVDKWLGRHGLKGTPLTVGTALAAPLLSVGFTSLIKLLTR
jgi:hypothetical protein